MVNKKPKKKKNPYFCEFEKTIKNLPTRENSPQKENGVPTNEMMCVHTFHKNSWKLCHADVVCEQGLLACLACLAQTRCHRRIHVPQGPSQSLFSHVVEF